MHVVFGANGRAGGETANALLERGETVRVVLKQADQGQAWKVRNADVAIASLDDADAVAAALEGAAAAFLLNPPLAAGDPYERADEIGRSLANAVRRAGLPRLVLLSSIGAQHASGAGIIGTLNRVEAHLAGAVPATAFLRSGYFIETWSEVAGTAIAAGTLPTFLELDRKIPMVSTIDVGRAAATLLSGDWTGQRVVELGGPQDWNAGDVARAFADVLNRVVTPVFVPADRRAAILAEAGVPTATANALLGMYEGIANGRFVREEGTEWRRGSVQLTTAIERIVARSPVTAS